MDAGGFLYYFTGYRIVVIRCVRDADIVSSNLTAPSVAVAQLAERRVVVPNVVGSTPIGHLMAL